MIPRLPPPLDSQGRPIGVRDRVSWRGRIYTIKTLGRLGAQLSAFCATLGIETKGMKAAWWLVSDWSE